MKNINDYKSENIEDFNIICFWKDYQKNGYLSNWYKVDFTVDGVKYNCMEQFFMAEKARFFKDEKKRQEILKADRQNIQKALGRQVKNFNEAAWNKVKVDITIKGLEAKFKQNKKLKDMLLSTADSILVEASPYDEIWGVGVSEEVAKRSFSNWKGENLLGFSLMYLRDNLL